MQGFHPMDLYSQKKSLETIMFNITWCIWSAGELACGLFIVVQTVLISKFFSKGEKYPLNSDTLPNMNFCGLGYLHRHVLLNNWLTLSYYLINSFIITAHYLIEVNRRHFRYFKPPCCSFNHFYSSETNIILDGMAARLMLSFVLYKWTYQV